MEHRLLGRSGCAVSTLALGTMTFGTETDEDGSRAQLDAFVASGGNLIDTADVYSDGASEEIVGRWLAATAPEVRDSVVIATKGRFPTGAGRERPRPISSAPAACRGRVAASARSRLHRPLSGARMGPVDAAGRDPASSRRHGAHRQDPLCRAVQLHRLAGAEGCRRGARAQPGGPVTLQPQYNLLVREVEWEIVPACLDAGLGLLPWSPLGGGWLTGKYRRDTEPVGATRLGENPDRGVEAYSRRSTQERTWDVVDAVRDVADRRGVSMAQVALAWLVDRPAVTSVILGARTLEQLEDNLGAADVHLGRRRPPPRCRERPRSRRLPLRRTRQRAAGR